jgi:N-acetylglucosamine malate deacetylase 1
MEYREFIDHSIRKIKGIKKDLIQKPRVVKKPRGKNILVIAPHFDDATLGCGGTILKHVLAKDKISIVYISNGKEGISRTGNKEQLSKTRKQEAKNAMSILGVENIHFLNVSEKSTKISEEHINRLSHVLKITKPDIVYAPWFLDNHIDHVKANHLLSKAQKKTDTNFNIAAYEIWTPLIPNILVDINSVAEKKIKAIKCFRSQLKDVDYLATTMSLNKYRSALELHGKKYAEAFLYLPAKEYFTLMFRK